MTAPIHIAALADSPIRCGVALFRHRGQLRVTAIVKATFSLVPGGVAALAAPSEIVREDRHHDDNPMGSVLAASDLAPYRPRVDVTFVGHAHAIGGAVRASSARLAIFRERAVVDKTIHVYGDRSWPANDRGPAPAIPCPFDRMPLVYERACASLHGPAGVENPVGIAQPNLVDARAPGKPAGFGPISRDWPGRARLLGAADRRALDAAIAEIPDSFDWGYFQAAPLDQQIDVLRGDEWIVLDGLHPTLPRLQTRLPSAVVVARVQRLTTANDGDEELLDLVPDTLAIDGDRQSCDVVWRGSFPVPGGEAALARLRIVAGLDLPGRSEAAASREVGSPARAPSRSPPALLNATLDVPSPAAAAPARVRPRTLIDAGLPLSMVAPFPLAAPASVRSPSPRIAGAPWAASPAPPVPKVADPLATTLPLVEAPAALRAPSRPANAGPPPVLPLTGSIYGRPRSKRR